MNTHGKNVNRDVEPGPVPPSDSKETPQPASGIAGRGRLWALAIAAGLFSGAIGWAGGEATLDLFHISEEAAGEAFDFSQANLERRSSSSRNAAIAFGLLGATLGLTLGLAGGLARGKPTAGLTGSVVGLVLGGAAGASIPFVVVPLYFDLFEPAEPTLLLPVLINGAIWLPIGLAAGLAFGMGIGGGASRIGAAVLGGMIGSVIGVGVIEVVNAVAFPLTHSDQFIPSVGPFSGDEKDWERFYLLRGPMTNAHESGEHAIDQFQLGTATAAAQQRLIARFTMPLLIAIGVAWIASRARPRPTGQDAGSPVT